MEQYVEDQRAVRQYLLGELGEEQQRQLEESLLTNSDLFDELLIAEDELIDEYLAGRLGEAERDEFEKHFLSTPERLQKLRFARAFKKHIAAATLTDPSLSTPDQPQPSSWKQWLLTILRAPNPALSFSLTAALLLVVGGGLWLFIHSSRGPEIVRNGERSPSNFFPVTLTPGVVREAGETNRVVIPKSADAVQLRLEVATDEYQGYRAVLQTDEGREIFTRDQLKVEKTGDGKMVVLVVPAKLLTSGDYQVKLGGINAGGDTENVGSYYFRLVKS